MASQAEARIRAKAEALLREHFPAARIIHEFELGGVRMDLAAVEPDRLALLEIKSELDTLSRLERQVKWAQHVGGPVIVCYAERWESGVRDLCSRASLWGAEWLRETNDGFANVHPMRLARGDRYNSRALLGLLLKPELIAMARPLGGKSKQTVPELSELVHEHLPGREIRRGVLAALRARRFGWTCDAPSLPRQHQPQSGSA